MAIRYLNGDTASGPAQNTQWLNVCIFPSKNLKWAFVFREESLRYDQPKPKHFQAPSVSKGQIKHIFITLQFKLLGLKSILLSLNCTFPFFKTLSKSSFRKGFEERLYYAFQNPKTIHNNCTAFSTCYPFSWFCNNHYCYLNVTCLFRWSGPIYKLF